ncbi:MAG TPA: enoyl-CoA hydratase-related protein [Acidimicrobiia bacterium]|nr:enoyl-CoA hydratase-related protein [Acidimicrobiia bacterium]
MDELLVERRGAVTLLTLNRPDAHNSVTGDMAAGLAETIDAFTADDSASVLVITGAGDRSFCAGANLKDIDALLRHPHTERAGPMGFAHLDPGKPTIAAVNGYCFAGGMELACWCDFRIASANAEFGALNRRWGVPFIDGGTQRFPRIMGQGNALWMIETGVRIDARRALAIGLVQEVVQEGTALDRALELADRIAGYPQASIRTDRAATLATWGLELDNGLYLESGLGRPTASDPDMVEGLRNFVTGNRPEAPRPA